MKFESILSTETIICKELSVKDYKYLLKGLFGEEVDQFAFVESICETLRSSTGLSAEYFKEMDLVDLFCLLLDLRINSLGDVCAINVTSEEKKLKIELNLDLIKRSILSLSKKTKQTICINDLSIELQYPSIVKSQNVILDEEYLGFIKSATFKGITVNIKTTEESKFLFESLPVKVSFKIIERVQEMYKQVLSLNFLAPYRVPNVHLNFNPTLLNLIWYTKLLYEEPLDVFYKNFFYMSYYGHMNASYLENISIGEYNYFVNCLKGALNPEKSNPEQEQPSENYSVDE